MFNKKISRTKDIFLYLASFMIPFFIIMLVYIGLRITPFGDRTLIVSDARGLYSSDLSFISRVLQGKESLLYSFQQGIGSNLLGSHSGLLNPANIIVLFFNITEFATMYSLLIAIDMSICGLTMFIFLSSAYEREDMNLIFSTVYALIGFNVANCFQYNFILSVELLPLIALGIRKIILQKKPWLYLGTLCYGIFASFYFGYMLCIASVVFFIMHYVLMCKGVVPEYRKRILINYFGSSVVAGLIPAFFWLPALLSFSGGRLNATVMSAFSFTENMTITELFAKFFAGANNAQELIDGKPNIFCGTLVIFLVIVYFVDDRNRLRDKIVYAAAIVFYLLTFYIRVLSTIMQGFSQTNWFNYRYSFVFSFILIVVAYLEFRNIQGLSSKTMVYSVTIFLIFILLIFSQRYSYVSGGAMVFGVLLLSLSLGAIWWNKIDEKRASRRVLVIVLVFLCSLECYTNHMLCTRYVVKDASKESVLKEYYFFTSLSSEAVTTSDSNFYRMVNEIESDDKCLNEPRLFGYNGMNYFGSCEKSFVFQGLSKLGLPWYANHLWYSEGIPAAFDSLLGIKYVISNRDLEQEKLYKKVFYTEKNDIYQNPYALPIGMISSESVREVILGRDPFSNINMLWQSISDVDLDVFTHETNIKFTYHEGLDGTEVDYQDALRFSTSLEATGYGVSLSNEQHGADISGDDTTQQSLDNGWYIECKFIAQQEGPIYAYSASAINDRYGAVQPVMHYLGYFKKGDVVIDKISLTTNLTMDLLRGICGEYYAAYANIDALEKCSNAIWSNSGMIDKKSDDHIIGTISPLTDSRLLFTIPYDDGWTLRVDGVEVPLEVTSNLFMSAKISAGTHTYEMVFFPKGMKTGIMISMVACILLILLILYDLRGLKKDEAQNLGKADASKNEALVIDNKKYDEQYDNKGI